MTASVTAISELRTPAAFAKKYLALGWWVLPLLPGTKRPFSRLVPNGFHNATNDPEVAARWWSAEPTAGVGIALKPSGLIAVDVDPRNGGFQTLDDLQSKFGKLESDVLQLTGGGGWHIVFHASDVAGLPGTLGRGIDLKADGYIAAEPTIHPSGTPYGWEASSSPLDGCIPSTLPGWIRDQARAPVQALVFEDAPMVPTPRWLDALAALPHIDSNARETWLAVGMAIHNERPDAEGFQAWCNWSEASHKFNFADQSRVWASFRRRGLTGATLNTVFAMAQKAGWRNSGTVVALPPSMVSNERLVVDLAQLGAMSKAVRWQVKHTIPAQSIGVMFGASGTFKSFIALDLCLHIAHGLPWLGKKTTKGTVVYVAAEGGAGLMRRITAWHMRRGLHLPMDRFFVCPRAVLMNSAAHTQRLRADIEAVCPGPDLVVIDTMSQTFDGNENSNDEVAGFFRGIQDQIMQPLGCGAIVIHHSGHAATERPRGASAITGNVDYLLGVFRDPQNMLATVSCEKQKDGEKFNPVPMVLDAIQVATDEDGEAVTSLVATFADTGGAEILKAAESKKGTRLAKLIAIVREFGDLQLIERDFKRYLAEDEGVEKADTRKHAFKATMKQARDLGIIVEGAGGCVQVVDNLQNGQE